MQRKVKTAYFDHEWNMQAITRSGDPNRATVNAFGHLQYNKYGDFNVRCAQVFDGETGELYSELIRVMEDNGVVGVYTVYKAGDPSTQYPRKRRGKEDVPRRSIAVLLGDVLDKIKA